MIEREDRGAKHEAPEKEWRFRLAVDVGGTFTDLILADESTRRIQIEKVPTTPQHVSRGVIRAIEKAGVGLDRIGLFLHGTTLALNAFLERKGIATGLITTKGFRDVLEIARTDRPEMYDILYQKPAILVRRYLRLEVDERMSAQGEVVRPLNKETALAAIRTLKREGVRSIAVCLLHAYANPEHEIALADLVRNEYPEASVSLSHAISREYYEYERTLSTVVNAYVKPIVKQYIGRLEEELSHKGFRGRFLVMRSSGGAMSPNEVKESPVHTLLSGPSGGVMGAVYLSKVGGMKNLICADAGGTSFDVSLVLNGKPILQSQTVLQDYKLLLPVLDIQSIGAGGGSIAWVDAGKGLQVGPESAGAEPGPICYGGGGTKPTVTDAAVVLGLIDPDNFLGGEMPLDRDASAQAILEQISRPLGLTLEQAAAGILTVITAKMAGLIRAITIERGHDPRSFSLLAFGGAGGLFAAKLGEMIKVRQVVVPRYPAHFSAWGMLTTDVVHDFSQTKLMGLDSVKWSDVINVFTNLEKQAVRALHRDGFKSEECTLFKSIEARYWAQGHLINLPVSDEELTEARRGDLVKKFHRFHQRAYGHRMDEPIVLANFRVRSLGQIRKLRSETLSRRGKSIRDLLAPTDQRRVWFYGLGRPVMCKVYDRQRLLAGDFLSGPALVEEGTSVTVIPPGYNAHLDNFGNLLIRGRQ